MDLSGGCPGRGDGGRGRGSRKGEMDRVWVSNGAGLLEEPGLVTGRSIRNRRPGEDAGAMHAGERVIAIEATGSLDGAWAA
jgi:hypothetical protein